jgi:hypothetical protein
MSPDAGYVITALAGVLVGLGVARAFMRGPLHLTQRVGSLTAPTRDELAVSTTLTYYAAPDEAADDAVWSALGEHGDTVVIATARGRFVVAVDPAAPPATTERGTP